MQPPTRGSFPIECKINKIPGSEVPKLSVQRRVAESCRRVHQVANVSENTSAALDFHENHEQTQETFCCFFFSFFPFFLLRRGRDKKAYTRSVPKTGSTTVGAGRALLHNPRGFSRQPMGVQRHQASVQSKCS